MGVPVGVGESVGVDEGRIVGVNVSVGRLVNVGLGTTGNNVGELVGSGVSDGGTNTGATVMDGMTVTVSTRRVMKGRGKLQAA